MPQIGPLEILVVGILALLVFGPEKLPDMARSVGRALNQLKTMASEAKSEFDMGLDDNDKNKKQVVKNEDKVVKEEDKVVVKEEELASTEAVAVPSEDAKVASVVSETAASSERDVPREKIQSSSPEPAMATKS